VRALERAQLAQVQLLSEASAKAEDAAREAAFVASARLEPVATFSDTSTFLVRRGGGAPALVFAPAAAVRFAFFSHVKPALTRHRPAPRLLRAAWQRRLRPARRHPPPPLLQPSAARRD
jgi:hypothetical protein